jgi:peroxiredoxin Q/BCP
MNRLLVSAAAAVTVLAAGSAVVAQQAPAAAPPLSVGTMAPAIQARAYMAGKPTLFTLSDAIKKGPVVLYFFPGAYTAGCNVEAKAFADASDKFAAAGAQVVGITGGFGTSDRQGPPAASLDEAVKDFSTTHCNSKFPVVVASADTIKDYRAVLTQRPEWSNRTSYVITPDDKIALAYVNASPNGHVDNTLKAVQDWRKANPGKAAAKAKKA